MTIDSESRRWLSGRAGRTKRVYDIVATDSQGTRREGVAVVTGGISGMAADVIDVRWNS
jgi:hypothetical protein